MGSNDRNLTAKQRRFVEEYCIDFNATQAAIRAGYSERTARQMGSENLAKPDIAEAVRQRLDEFSMSAGEATKRLTEWGRGSITPFLRQTATGEVVLDLSTAEARENLHLIKKVKVQETRVDQGDEAPDLINVRTEIELHDAKDAVVQMAKIRQLFVEKHEHTGPGGGPLEVAVTRTIIRPDGDD